MKRKKFDFHVCKKTVHRWKNIMNERSVLRRKNGLFVRNQSLIIDSLKTAHSSKFTQDRCQVYRRFFACSVILLAILIVSSVLTLSRLE